jgi:hypothetical protein
MVKWAVAAIPAVLILVIVGVGLAAIFGGLAANLGGLGQVGPRGQTSAAPTITFHRTQAGVVSATNDSEQDRENCSAQLSDGRTVQLPALKAHQPVFFAERMMPSEPTKVQCGGTDTRVYWIQDR